MTDERKSHWPCSSYPISPKEDIHPLPGIVIRATAVGQRTLVVTNDSWSKRENCPSGRHGGRLITAPVAAELQGMKGRAEERRSLLSPCLCSAVYQHQGMLGAASCADEKSLRNREHSLAFRVHPCLRLALDSYGNVPIMFVRHCRSSHSSDHVWAREISQRCFLSHNLYQGSPLTLTLRVARREPGVFKPSDGLFPG